jgi:hypothetical protein
MIGLPRRAGLPLHIVGRVCAAVLKGLNEVDHVERTRAKILELTGWLKGASLVEILEATV